MSNNRNWPPFYIENDRPTFASQLRDLSEAFEMLEKLKAGQKPKEDKKEEKPNVFKTWLLTTIGLFAAFPFMVWISMSLYMDLILKAKHLPLP